MNMKVNAYPLFTLLVIIVTLFLVYSIIVEWQLPFLFDIYAVSIHGIVLFLWSFVTVSEISKRFVQSRVRRFLFIILGTLVVCTLILIPYINFISGRFF